MPAVALSHVSLPVEREVLAAMKGQRDLAAFLATRLETQQILKLLEEGALPFHKAGKHRRVRFADLMRFKTQREQASAQAMAALAEQAQELRMGYE